MGVFHVLFLMPDNLDVVIIGPFRIMKDRESHSKLKSLVDADVYHHLKEYLVMIPTIRENLMNVVWGYAYSGDYRTVDVHIRRLREKLESNPAEPEYIMTKWGVGYYFKG